MKLTACLNSLKDKFAGIEKLSVDRKPEDCDAEKLEEILTLYSGQRIKEYSVMMTNFEKEFATAELARREALEGVVLMELGISSAERRASYLLYYQLMFDDNTYIKPITPLAREVLLSFWQKPFWDRFEETIRFILKNEKGDFTNDARGRAAERYFLYCVEQTKTLKLELRKIQAEATPKKWEKHSFQVISSFCTAFLF